MHFTNRQMHLMCFEKWTGWVDKKFIGEFLLEGWTEKFWMLLTMDVDKNLIHR